MSHLVTWTFVLGLLSFARASLDNRGLVETNATCQENFGWAFSMEALSPCLLLAAVSAPCYQGEYFTRDLPPGNHYDPPLKANGTVNQCSCSWAAYNLMMACTVCQGRTSSVSTWPGYRAECGNLISSTTYWPSDIMIASNHNIPFYAGQNPDQWTGQSFNVTEAKLLTAESKPDLTGAPSPKESTPSQQKAKPVGAIVGGTIGGVVLLALALLLLLYTYRHKRASLTLHGLSPRGPGYFALPGSPPFSTNSTPSTMHTFSQLGTPSMYAYPQTPSWHQHYSMVGSPPPITQIVTPQPPASHIEPFMLMSPGESPETVARRRKESVTRGAPPSSSRSQTAPTIAVVSRGQQTAPERVHRLQGVAGEDGPRPRIPRGRSKSQPPAYDTLLLETNEVAAASAAVAVAQQERSGGHSHRTHERSRGNGGSQDSQTSWVTFGGGVSGSSGSHHPPAGNVIRQQPRDFENELLIPRGGGPSRGDGYRSVQGSSEGDHPGVEVA